MHLKVEGHPLHSRALAVTLLQRADGKLDVQAYLLDLRKRGFVPVAGDLQASGIIHHMKLNGVIDPARAVLERISAEQPAVAFEASALSGGESCRDPIDRIAALAGTPLDSGYARRLVAEIGGPRGCSHILTLAQLLGSTASWVLEGQAAFESGAGRFRPGERVFRRDVIIDGHEPEPGRVTMAVQLTDLHLASAPPVARPMDRFAGQLEVRLLATADTAKLALVGAVAAERRRGPEDLATAPWRDRTSAVSGLAGLKLFSGVSGELVRHFDDRAEDRPLLDALLMVAPAFLQCAGALSEDWPIEAQRGASIMGTGGYPDSCYIWRREGTLGRALLGEMKSGALKLRR
jgi:hypothetical protein